MNIKSTLALLSSCLIMQNAFATFNAQDPRALGMGGVGTASANSAQAHFYNPSLLVNADPDEDFNLQISVTARAADPDNLVDSVDDFATNKYIENFDLALTNINIAIDTSTITPASLITLRDDLVNAASGLRAGINNLSNKAFILSGNGGIVTSVPNSDFGWAAYINAWGDAGIELFVDPRDDAIMGGFIDTLNSLSITGIQSLPDPVNNLFSGVKADIIVVKEFGVSLAIPYQLNNYSFDVGITPKFMSVDVYGYSQTLEQSENDSNVINLDDSNKYSSFNADFGLSKKLDENWKTGFFVKNIIPQSFKSKSGSKLEISPEFRVGTSYQNNWAIVAVDFDLTKNKAPASSSESRYLAIGSELDLWIAKIRLGYRANLAASNNNVASLGLGFNIFGLNLDLAAAFGQGSTGANDVNASAQIGLQW